MSTAHSVGASVTSSSAFRCLGLTSSSRPARPRRVTRTGPRSTVPLARSSPSRSNASGTGRSIAVIRCRPVRGTASTYPTSSPWASSMPSLSGSIRVRSASSWAEVGTRPGTAAAASRSSSASRSGLVQRSVSASYRSSAWARRKVSRASFIVSAIAARAARSSAVPWAGPGRRRVSSCPRVRNTPTASAAARNESPGPGADAAHSATAAGGQPCSLERVGRDLSRGHFIIIAAAGLHRKTGPARLPTGTRQPARHPKKSGSIRGRVMPNSHIVINSVKVP